MRDHDTVSVGTVPNVVVIEPVAIDVETVRVDVHIGNEEVCGVPSMPPPFYGM